MAPMYIKLVEMQNKLDKDFFGNLFKWEWEGYNAVALFLARVQVKEV
jgi:hypothetical protein